MKLILYFAFLLVCALGFANAQYGGYAGSGFGPMYGGPAVGLAYRNAKRQFMADKLLDKPGEETSFLQFKDRIAKLKSTKNGLASIPAAPNVAPAQAAA